MQLGVEGALGRAMLEDQENLIFTVQKAVHWLIIYSFFM